jgi:hypothetical protein
MFQPDMFEDCVHPVHSVIVDSDGSVTQLNFTVTEEYLGSLEELSRNTVTGNLKFWRDGTTYHKVIVFPRKDGML